LISRKKLSADLLSQQMTTIFLCAVGGIFFSKCPSKDGQLLARLPRPNPHKEEKMANVKVPERLDPQDIVKLLVALRRALKAGVA
jgi:hypothetical protein